MKSDSASIAYITAGAAGMYCGSCMHDNALARGLTNLGHDVQLIPTYTPIRTDEDNVSLDRVFYGGISVYLEQKWSWYRSISRWVSPLVDQGWLIRLATRRASSTDARMLGDLTVSMLRGTDGRQALEARKLCEWLEQSVHPDVVLFSNVLIAGCLPTLKATIDAPVLVVLQGDDLFLEQLPDANRTQAIQEIQRLVANVDGFLVHSDFYADFMSEYLAIPRQKFRRIPLGLDTAEFPTAPQTRPSPKRIGYLARLAPEKGFHLLVDAFIQLRQLDEFRDLELHAAGWAGEHHKPYIASQMRKLADAGCGESYRYLGSVSRQEKIELLKSIDLLSVPTVQREPKGLFVLEALAAGVPVVQPDHGAFPELLADLGGGQLVAPTDVESLANGIAELLRSPDRRAELGQVGQTAVHGRRDLRATAEATWEVMKSFL